MSLLSQFCVRSCFLLLEHELFFRTIAHCIICLVNSKLKLFWASKLLIDKLWGSFKALIQTLWSGCLFIWLCIDSVYRAISLKNVHSFNEIIVRYVSHSFKENTNLIYHNRIQSRWKCFTSILSFQKHCNTLSYNNMHTGKTRQILKLECGQMHKKALLNSSVN